MGGHGSGRRRSYSGKPETDDCCPLDIRKLNRRGLLVPGSRFSWQWTVGQRVAFVIALRVDGQGLVLMYRPSSSDVIVEQQVQIERTSCRFGGQRPWFTCPRCDRRVAVLYAPARQFACRQCGRLAYGSQKESAGGRALRQADAIRKRLGWRAGIIHGPGYKPKGMHWKTFERLERHHDELSHIYFQESPPSLA